MITLSNKIIIGVVALLLISSGILIFYYFDNKGATGYVSKEEVQDTMQESQENIPLETQQNNNLAPENNLNNEAQDSQENSQENNTSNTNQTTLPQGGSSGGGGGGGSSGTTPVEPTCTPSLTCANYLGICANSLSNGCENILDCINNCNQYQACVNGICEKTCTNDPSCLSEGFFCNSSQRYECRLNSTTECLEIASITSCTDGCFNGECLSNFEIDSCTEINSPGNYKLNTSIINNNLTSSCIKITSSGVNLDCNNNLINSTNSVSGIYINSTNSVSIKNCYVDMGTSSGGYGIEAESSSNILVENNTLNTQYSGIYFHNYVNNSQIINNIINYNTNKGIHISMSKNITILNNNVNYGSFYGILSTKSYENIITNNNLDSNIWYGVLIEASLDSNPDGNNTIINNMINNSRSGIYVKTNSNIISNNTLRKISMYPGIYVYGSENNSVKENDIRNGANYGIRIRNASFNIIQENIITNNSQAGLEVSSTSFDNIIESNVICNNSALDVYCETNQTFIDNSCGLENVCGGACSSCAGFSGASITGMAVSIENKIVNKAPLLISILSIIALIIFFIARKKILISKNKAKHNKKKL